MTPFSLFFSIFLTLTFDPQHAHIQQHERLAQENTELEMHINNLKAAHAAQEGETKQVPLMFGLFNSLAAGRSEYDSWNVIFNLDLLIGVFRSSFDNALQLMPQDITDDKSKLVQVMAWCCQATSHYLKQCWPRSPTPYGVPRPQWVLTQGPWGFEYDFR